MFEAHRWHVNSPLVSVEFVTKCYVFVNDFFIYYDATLGKTVAKLLSCYKKV